MAATFASPGVRTQVPLRRRAQPSSGSGSRSSSSHRPSPARSMRQEAPEIKPIAWPEDFKRTLPVGRLIRLESSAPIEVPFFTSLPYDVRREVYDIMLRDAGFRQHVFCPSICRVTLARELFTRYLVCKKCDDDTFQAGTVCGHWQCEDHNNTPGTAAATPPAAGDANFQLSDLISLMKTCKFGYLEVSEYFYRSITFTFASFPELRVFLERLPATALSRVRSVAFIAHMLPHDPQACQRFIGGEYFETAEAAAGAGGENHMALFKRIPNLKVLDINFFPSLILALSTRLVDVVRPLQQLPDSTRVTVRIPNMVYSGISEIGLPTASRLGEGANFTLKRPNVAASSVQQNCRAYSYSF
ncbi:hypothetical protein B0T24DRAFT_217491 [Lasiosphaeria ovina]|uniref:DUF7730 domain-containing protein n=1 Tax=Lasiosphaeria ovina TaxID=92902 RepID=A0AAE0KGF0_9PEZI|nr:hypothetical protein B0T24DRAFT_217491 [Lasiosphaeria ovina]